MKGNNVLSDVLINGRKLSETGITFIEGAENEVFVSYNDLHDRALKALSFIQKRGIRPKEELVFQLEDNMTFVTVFWACILGGIIPVPLSIGKNEEHKQKLFRIWPILNNPHLITSSDHFSKLESFAREHDLSNNFKKIEQNTILSEKIDQSKNTGDIYQACEDDIAFIQFSSGSTGEPKGVVLTHKNLMVNMTSIGKAASYTKKDTTISWMPLTHDMGLIGFHLNPILYGMNQCLIPTDYFVRRPSIWLEASTNHAASILCSPNFGYGYLLKYCSGDKENNWDLSNVRLLYNGAEPISVQLCDEFLTEFSKYGLKRKVMCPVYGLAEASLAVSISSLDDDVIPLHLTRGELGIGKTVHVVGAGKDTVSFVNVGKPIDECHVRVTGDEDLENKDLVIGHIQIKGDNVTSGYYNNIDATRNAQTNDHWTRTGDLGFTKDGSLYVTGRFKDIIFSNGQNYYPHDIERVAQEVEGVELNKVAVAGWLNPDTNQEETVAFVMHRGSLETFVTIAKSIQILISGRIGLELSKVLPIKNISKTTSGKLQRFKLIEKLNDGFFTEIENQFDLLKCRLRKEESSSVQEVTEAEQKIIDICQRFLGSDKVILQQNFLENGGNSMKAAGMAMGLYKELQIDVPLDKFFKDQSFIELVREVLHLKSKTYAPIPKLSDKNRYALTASQKGIFYAWHTDKKSIAYNTPFAFKIEGSLDVNRLEACVNSLILRHDSLRTSFGFDSNPYFTISESSRITIDHETIEQFELDEVLKSLVIPFDLMHGPLFRISLLTVNNQGQFLFLDFHHIISDGVSFHNFIEELIRIYSNEKLEEEPVRFRDYTQWEAQQAKLPEVNLQEEFWVDDLDGTLPILDLPIDFDRPPVFSRKGEKVFFEINQETTQALNRLAKGNNCTLHTTLYTVYLILLAKYTGQEDILIGVPTSGRRHPDIRKTQGMFVNNLAVRNAIQPEESFSELLQRQHLRILKALENQDFTFASLIEKIGGERDVSRNPIFDTMFVFQNMGSSSIESKSLTLTPYFFDPGFSKFDISMEVFEDGSILKYGIEFCTSLFRKATILRLSTHFENIINTIITDPKVAIADVSVMCTDEVQEHIEGFNETANDYPQAKKVHQLFLEQVIKAPDAIALELGVNQMTYKQLDEQAVALAHILIEKGIGSGSIVGIMLPRSEEFVICALGVLKSGGAYVPMDTDLPLERLKFIMSDSQCAILLTNSQGRLKTADTNSHEILDVEELQLTSKPVLPLTEPAESNDIAYVIYTSGSTGEPKGVQVKHKSLVNYLTWASEYYIGKEEMTFPLFTSIAFDLSVTSIFTPLITGNKIVIYEEEERSFSLDRVIEENKVDIIKLTPSHLNLLRYRGELLSTENNKVKRLIVGGEQLDTKLAQDIYEMFGGRVEIFNEYGPTEATVGCMIHRFNPLENNQNVSIGKPIDNSKIYILDKSLRPVPYNVKGQLYISGDCLAQGYVQNEELTSDKFISNPFISQAKMYQTGDVARRLDNGFVEFVGREDNQVKIDGYRIELSEIERHLTNYREIDQAVVVTRTNEADKKYLCAYYSLKGSLNDPIQDAILTEYLIQNIPHYMVPVRFVFLDRIPLTSNGKVDINRLPTPHLSEVDTNVEEPQSEFERLSLAIWRDILGVDALTITDNFFEHGGDSIKAVQITARLFNEGMSLTVKDILTYRTIRQISLNVDIVPAVNQYEQGNISGCILPSPIQCWFFSKEFKNPNHYNQSVLLRLSEKVNIEFLEQTFRQLIRMHDAFRLRYDAEKGQLCYNNQHLDQEFSLFNYDITTNSNNEKSKSQVFEELKSSLSIESGTLIKAAVIDDRTSSKQLFITIHHLIVDGVSWRIFLDDLYTLYSSLEHSEKINLPRKTASLIDWNRVLLEYKKEYVSQEEKEYWNAEEDSNFKVPMDFENINWAYANRTVVIQFLNEEYTGFLLRNIQQAYKIDVPIVLNLALLRAVKEWTKQSVVVIEQENHGRHLNDIDTSRTLGWFTAMFPVKLELIGDDIEDQIKGVKEQMRAVPNNGVGFGIYKHFESDVTTGNEMSQIRLNYLGQFDSELNNELFSFEQENTGPDVAPENNMTAVIEIDAMVINGMLELKLNYNKTAHSEETAMYLAEQTMTNLRHILDHIILEENIHFTPSDFSAKDLDESDLEAIFE